MENEDITKLIEQLRDAQVALVKEHQRRLYAKVSALEITVADWEWGPDDDGYLIKGHPKTDVARQWLVLRNDIWDQPSLPIPFVDSEYSEYLRVLSPPYGDNIRVTTKNRPFDGSIGAFKESEAMKRLIREISQTGAWKDKEAWVTNANHVAQTAKKEASWLTAKAEWFEATIDIIEGAARVLLTDARISVEGPTCPPPNIQGFTTDCAHGF